jgi:hypothetical protein
MSGLVAQAQPDPDLTAPIAVIVVCAVLIVVTLVVQRVRARRRNRPATPEDLHRWQESGGRLLDPWIDGVQGELRALRSAPFPDTVPPFEDPAGFEEAVADCPDRPLAQRIADLRSAAGAMLATARAGDPNRPDVAAAEARFAQAKEQAGTHLRDAFSAQGTAGTGAGEL